MADARLLQARAAVRLSPNWVARLSASASERSDSAMRPRSNRMTPSRLSARMRPSASPRARNWASAPSARPSAAGNSPSRVAAVAASSRASARRPAGELSTCRYHSSASLKRPDRTSSRSWWVASSANGDGSMVRSVGQRVPAEPGQLRLRLVGLDREHRGEAHERIGEVLLLPDGQGPLDRIVAAVAHAVVVEVAAGVVVVDLDPGRL